MVVRVPLNKAIIPLLSAFKFLVFLEFFRAFLFFFIIVKLIKNDLGSEIYLKNKTKYVVYLYMIIFAFTIFNLSYILFVWYITF